MPGQMGKASNQVVAGQVGQRTRRVREESKFLTHSNDNSNGAAASITTAATSTSTSNSNNNNNNNNDDNNSNSHHYTVTGGSLCKSRLQVSQIHGGPLLHRKEAPWQLATVVIAGVVLQDSMRYRKLPRRNLLPYVNLPLTRRAGVC